MSSQGSIQILMIEDSPADVAVIRALLAKVRARQFQLEQVGLLAEGMARVEQSGIDVVLLDLSLPDSHGIGGCKQLAGQSPRVPIVVLTGLDDEAVAIETVQQGAQDYLVKGQIDSNLLGRSLLYAIERKRIEAELQQAHDKLEQRVDERTAELREKNAELKMVIRQRDRAEQLARRRQEELAHVARLNTLGEMASTMAHELNQPLTAIVGYTRSCLSRMENAASNGDGLYEELAVEIEKTAEQAKRGGEIIKRLRRLVRKRESDRMATDINDCVDAVVQFVGPDIRRSRVDVQVELDESLPRVQADRIQIEQVLLNLVRNAFDAMKECDTRRIVISTAVDKQNSIEVKVTDRGPAIDAVKLGVVFDPFYSTKEDGLGLGLSISKSIIEAHQGKLTVAPNTDQGLTFRFTLPIDEADVTGLGRGWT